MIRIILKLIRFLVFAAFAAAGLAKLLLESHAEPETEEIDLVSIYATTNLASRATPFYGGKILAMFSATTLDLTQAAPAPTGIDLDLILIAGTVNLIVPAEWRVRSEVTIYLGTIQDVTQHGQGPDAPQIVLHGAVCAGSVSVTNPVESKEQTV